jgi:TRAP transporter 4TM/12TM fusion protein
MAEEQNRRQIRYNSFPLPIKVLIHACYIVGVGLGIYFMFGFSFGGFVFLDAQYYYILFGIFGGCAFLILPEDKKIRWHHYVMAAFYFSLSLYFAYHAKTIALIGWIPASPVNLVLGFIYLVMTLEGCRRGTGGIAWPLVALGLGIYPLIADRFPGVFRGIEQPFETLVSLYVYGGDGIRGIPGQVMGGILMGFLIFAAFLIATGAGKFFLDISYALLGRYRGGPAKVAVVSSGFFGSLSGSIAANIVSTGSVTIPAMRKLGYPAFYAGALEACASTGGVLMPPVMGVTAFVVAAVLETPYYTIMLAALIPSVLYYFGLLVQADAYAAKAGIKGLPKEKLPSIRPVLKRGWPFLLVLAFLVWGLLIMEWENLTPFYASLLLIALSFLNRENRITIQKFFNALRMAGDLISRTTIIMLPAGILISCIAITGVGASFTTGAVNLGGGSVILIMIIGVAACYVMGMAGMTLSAYIFLAVTMAPAMIKIGGFDELAVHMFILYYTLLAWITPPVAPSAFVASVVAKASPMRIGITSMRLGIALYFVPFFFVYNPALILQGSLVETFYLFVFCLIGLWLLGGGLEGYLAMVGRPALWTRPFLLVGGFMIALPGLKSTIIGAILSAIVIWIIRIMNKGKETEPIGEEMPELAQPSK